MPSRLSQKDLRRLRAHLRNARPERFAQWLRISQIDPRGLDERAMNQLLDMWNEYREVKREHA